MPEQLLAEGTVAYQPKGMKNRGAGRRAGVHESEGWVFVEGDGEGRAGAPA